MQHTIEDTLAKLVAMPTISDDAVANVLALDFLEAQFVACGLHTKRFTFDGHGALIATAHPHAMHARVLLYGHVDVIPAIESLFTLRRDGDKLIGRGTLDMKSALAAYIHVAGAIQDQPNSYDVMFMITSDEEYGGRDDINSIPHLLKLGYRADVCIMPDGGRAWDVEAAAKGYWRFDLVARGVSAHGSRPWEGDSASFKLVQALQELRLRFNKQGPDTDTLNIGKIHGNGTYNQIPSEMIACIEIRLSAAASYTTNKALVEALCAKYELLLIERCLEKPSKQAIDHPLVQAFMHSITAITGHVSQPCLSHGGSDAHYFAAYTIPCAITYLPGGGHHSDSEWVSRKALRQFPAVLQHYLAQTARRI